MYNEVIMIKKLETDSKQGPFFMALGRKLRNGRQIQIEDFFKEITRFLWEHSLWSRSPNRQSP